ncbi:MAG: TetR/AcrR family transcriptional regulator [Acidobacteriota bacterium]
MTAPSASTRRAPLQVRSSETVKAILDAASSVLGSVPFEQVTTSRIAEAAGLSVGALYRFYSDKQEIYDAIAVRELTEFRQQIEQTIHARQLLFSPRKSLDRILDAYVGFLDTRPHFRELALGRHISPQTRENQSDPKTGPGGILQDLLVKKFGIKPGRQLQLKIRIAAEVGDRLIAYAYSQPTAKDRKEVLDELKEMLGRYLLRL